MRIIKHTLQVVFIFLFLALSFNSKAQTDLGSYFMPTSWGANQLNPSFADSAKLQIHLPIIGYQFFHSPKIGLDEIIFQNGDQNVLSLDAVLDNLEDENEFNSDLEINTLAVGIRFKKFLFSLSHKIRFSSQLNYSDKLAQLIWNGNAQFIGETVEFGPELTVNAFHEIGLGLQYELTNKLSIGGKVKYLSGIGSVVTRNSSASLFTSEDIYQLTFETDYVLQNSSFLEINGVNDFNFTINRFTLDNLFSSNIGLGIDLGLNYQVTPKLNISASVTDLGSITWNDNTTEFSSIGEFDYDGVDLSNFFADDSLEFDIKLDTLEQIFGFQESSTASYQTQLNSAFYLSGQYDLTEKISIGLLYRNIFGNNRNDSAIALNAQYRISNIIQVGLNYAYLNQQADNLGIMGLVKLGPVQLFGSTDNILGLIGSGTGNNANGRIGISILL